MKVRGSHIRLPLHVVVQMQTTDAMAERIDHITQPSSHVQMGVTGVQANTETGVSHTVHDLIQRRGIALKMTAWSSVF